MVVFGKKQANGSLIFYGKYQLPFYLNFLDRIIVNWFTTKLTWFGKVNIFIIYQLLTKQLFRKTVYNVLRINVKLKFFIDN